MPTVVPVFTLLLLAPGVAGATTGALAGAAIGGTLGLLLLVSVVVISLKYYRWRRSQFLGFRVKALTDASRRAIGDLHTALHLPAIIPGARGAAAGRAKSGLTRQGTSVRNWLRDGTRHSLHLSDRPVATKASSKGSSSKHTRDGGAAAAPGAAAEIGGEDYQHEQTARTPLWLRSITSWEVFTGLGVVALCAGAALLFVMLAEYIGGHFWLLAARRPRLTYRTLWRFVVRSQSASGTPPATRCRPKPRTPPGTALSTTPPAPPSSTTPPPSL